MTRREYVARLTAEMMARQEAYRQEIVRLEEEKRALFRKLATIPGLTLSPSAIAYAHEPVDW